MNACRAIVNVIGKVLLLVCVCVCVWMGGWVMVVSIVRIQNVGSPDFVWSIENDLALSKENGSTLQPVIIRLNIIQ